MTSSVDPTIENAAIIARLQALSGVTYEGISQGTVLPVDAFGDILPYRDIQPGSMIPAAQQRMLAAPEQSQPYVWAFQVSHVAPSRAGAWVLSVETDKSLIGWAPSVNAGHISTFYFTVYDEFNRNGDRVQWTATRFYDVTLGMKPDQ